MISTVWHNFKFNAQYRLFYAALLAISFTLLSYCFSPQHPYWCGIALVCLAAAYERR